MSELLVAGVGNVFAGDDGFGCEVIRRLVSRPLPEGVVARDFGVAALDLRFWLERHPAVIVVDAAPRGRAPGTVVVLEPTASAPASAAPDAESGPHGLSATEVIAWASERGRRGENPRWLRLVGCEPADLGDPEEGAFGLSEPVGAAVEVAVERVLALIASYQDGRAACTSSA